MTLNFTCAPATSAVADVGSDRPQHADPARYYVIDPAYVNQHMETFGKVSMGRMADNDANLWDHVYCD